MSTDPPKFYLGPIAFSGFLASLNAISQGCLLSVSVLPVILFSAHTACASHSSLDDVTMSQGVHYLHCSNDSGLHVPSPDAPSQSLQQLAADHQHPAVLGKVKVHKMDLTLPFQSRCSSVSVFCIIGKVAQVSFSQK